MKTRIFKMIKTGVSAFAAFFVAVVFSVSCDTGSASSDTPEPAEPAKVNTMVIEGMNAGKWVYVSLIDGKTVGESKFGDSEADKLWKERKDWDIAFCGEHIRMNGGTSGVGNAAIQNLSNKSFNALEEAPLDGFLYDSENVIVK